MSHICCVCCCTCCQICLEITDTKIYWYRQALISTQVQEFWNRCPHVESCGTQVSTDTVAVSNSDWLQLSIMAVRSTFDNVETPFARRLFSRFLVPASNERKELAHFFC